VAAEASTFFLSDGHLSSHTAAFNKPKGGLTMSKRSIVLSIAAALALSLTASVQAGTQADTYQVTGPVTELTDTKIVVMKGEEKFEVERDKDTKVTGDLKVGSKVTIKYRMYATTVAVKEATN
jgi:hypothetical protein